MLPIFEPELRRAAILELPDAPNCRVIKIAVHRNHAFETIASVLSKFLGFSGLRSECVFSSYDDALGFAETDGADLHILFIDCAHYHDEISAFLAERIAALRAQSGAPIAVIYLAKNGEKVSVDLPTDSYIFAANEMISELGAAAFDEAKTAYSGTRLSGKANLAIARELGLRIIPALLLPALKAVVFDLDNTLYDGVLGEDGIAALKPYLKVQAEAKRLLEAGFFVAIASKNDERDAKELFKIRTDFMLRFEDFSAYEINWQPKRDNLQKIAKTLNIGIDSMLFVDDNIAEITSVEPLGIHTIHADTPDHTLAQLRYFPRLMKLRKSAEDGVRSRDIQANKEREELAKELTPKEYFKKLAIRLVFAVNDHSQIARVAELFGKTNQFILTYKRYSETETTALMQGAASCVITIAMSDKLSDSGVIAIVAAHNDGGTLVIDELTVSCRALGRGIESVMLPFLFHLAAKKLGTTAAVKIGYKKGDRNAPALCWLAALSGESVDRLGDSGVIDYETPAAIDTEGLEITVRD
ncbi:haloacid dehalogenase [Campylobacterota bacterium]|nr:haloacid dehalogenase [Campylobacterota bacterium]